MLEIVASAASPSKPSWTQPMSATSINAAPVTLTYSLVAAYGGALSDGASPRLFGAGNPVIVNATTGSLGLNAPLFVTDASQLRAVGVYITRAAYTATVLVADNSGLSSIVNVSMLILVANSATSNALLTGVSPATGLDTLGGTSITLAGSSFEGLVGLSPVVTYGVCVILSSWYYYGRSMGGEWEQCHTLAPCFLAALHDFKLYCHPGCRQRQPIVLHPPDYFVS